MGTSPHVISTREKALSAAKLIRQRGLARNHLFDDERRFCFVGAVLFVLAPENYELPDNELNLWWVTGHRNSAESHCFDRIFDSANQILRQRDDNSRDVIAWNNTLGRTAEEVAELLVEVAERSAELSASLDSCGIFYYTGEVEFSPAPRGSRGR